MKRTCYLNSRLRIIAHWDRNDYVYKLQERRDVWWFWTYWKTLTSEDGAMYRNWDHVKDHLLKWYERYQKEPFN